MNRRAVAAFLGRPFPLREPDALQQALDPAKPFVHLTKALDLVVVECAAHDREPSRLRLLPPATVR